MAKAGTEQDRDAFQIPLCCAITSNLGFLLPSQAGEPPLETSPKTVKGTELPTRVHQGKVITEKTLLHYEERLAYDRTVDCLEYIAIVASAI